ncbi:MAG: hypothetical protein R3B70_07240 [Polyangiaceae bacterium]
MFSVERRVGRLVEARVHRLSTASEVERYRRAFTSQMLMGGPILIADHRPVHIYPQDVASKLTDIFRTLNPYWDRAALLIAPTNATLGLQLRRVVRDSLSPSRRVFVDAGEAYSFLSEALQPNELARMTAFLEESAPPSGQPVSGREPASGRTPPSGQEAVSGRAPPSGREPVSGRPQSSREPASGREGQRRGMR